MTTPTRLPARQSLRFGLLASISLLLSACSGTFDRFSDYPNVNTSSLPENQSADDPTRASPVERASITPTKPAWQNAGQQRATRAAGGTIVVQPGQTLYSIARANNITPDELAAMNSLPPPYALKTGMSLRVPNPNATAQAVPTQPQSVQAANAPVPAQDFAQAGSHTVKPGETLFSIGRAYNVHPYTIAQYNKLPQPYTLSTGQQLRIPRQGASQMALAPQPNAQQQNTLQLPAQQQQQAKVQPAPQAPAQQQIAAVQQPVAEEAPVASTFRWPVKGRVISTYGQKPNGMRNEGINISVPEGTSIRAAESGVVAYAGNELKGYGNLVLIRHDSGWVTAYAHGKELMVKRGDTVKRGDVIAKAGQTGSVTSPQLHFELRKGASAVDPMKHLGADQASN